MKIIEVNNITKEYKLGSHAKDSIKDSVAAIFGKGGNNESKIFRALENISFDVEKGEVLGLVGKNGAGKSTLLKVLSRITHPTSGEIMMKGRVASLLEVGTGFHPELSGRENIFLNGAVLGMSKKEITEKFEEIVDFSGVRSFIDTPVKRYSSGMYVRLAFSVAAHLEPEILIIDEVLAVGDAEFQKKCIGKMKDVAGAGRTVLFVSHNMEAVKSLCNRAILLEKGKIVLNSSVDEVVSKYLDNQKLKSFNMENTFDSKGSVSRVETLKVMAADKKEPFFSNKEQIEFTIDVFIDDAETELDAIDLNVSVFIDDIKLVMFFGKDLIEGNEFKHGKNSLTVKIPIGFLNKGMYYVNLLLHKRQTQKIHQIQEAISFQVLTNSETLNKYSGLRTKSC